MRMIGRILCALGAHREEPVAVNRREPHVLLKCERCEVHRTLLGIQAEQWIARFMKDGNP